MLPISKKWVEFQTVFNQFLQNLLSNLKFFALKIQTKRYMFFNKFFGHSVFTLLNMKFDVNTISLLPQTASYCLMLSMSTIILGNFRIYISKNYWKNVIKELINNANHIKCIKDKFYIQKIYALQANCNRKNILCCQTPLYSTLPEWIIKRQYAYT